MRSHSTFYVMKIDMPHIYPGNYSRFLRTSQEQTALGCLANLILRSVLLVGGNQSTCSPPGLTREWVGAVGEWLADCAMYLPTPIQFPATANISGKWHQKRSLPPTSPTHTDQHGEVWSKTPITDNGWELMQCKTLKSLHREANGRTHFMYCHCPSHLKARWDWEFPQIYAWPSLASQPMGWIKNVYTHVWILNVDIIEI